MDICIAQYPPTKDCSWRYIDKGTQIKHNKFEISGFKNALKDIKDEDFLRGQ